MKKFLSYALNDIPFPVEIDTCHLTSYYFSVPMLFLSYEPTETLNPEKSHKTSPCQYVYFDKASFGSWKRKFIENEMTCISLSIGKEMLLGS